MNKINIGVFPCGSEVGLEVFRSLRYYRHFNVIGLSSVSDHGVVVFDNYCGDIPFVTDVNFIPKINKIVQDLEIKFIIPAMDEAGYFLKKNEKNLNCDVVYPELHTAEIIRQKSATYNALKGIIKTPKYYTYDAIKEDDFPLFIKPDIGYGSRGAKLIDNKEQLKSYSYSIDEYVICENLPGKEFTVDCFSNQNNEVLFSGARERVRIRMGISVATRTVDNQELFKDIAVKISKTLKMSGTWFFQVKEDVNSNLTLLEVGGRVAGSMSLYRGLGINFVAADIFQRLGNDVSFPKLVLNQALLERSFDCKIVMNLDFDAIYCDLDDCLIIKDKVNVHLLSFLYQSFNNGKQLILLTRHLFNPVVTLKKHKIYNLFDDIIHIQNKLENKSSYISIEKSIFIDDSFKERNEVSSQLNIPTFAPDAIDLLLR